MKYPPFCPNKNCSMHHLTHKSTLWYTMSGSYTTSVFGYIKRFRCRKCNTRFSEQSFSLDYSVKRRLPYDYIFKQLKSAAGIRDIARDLRVSPTTIINRITRLSRQAQAVHTSLSNTVCLNEDLVADGFESFAVSQYFPDNIHLLAGKDSQYMYSFDYAHLRRKGRMTEHQKKVNRIMKKRLISGISITKSFTNICQQVDILLQSRITEHSCLYTDEKPQYRRVISGCGFSKSLSHITVNSKVARTLTNDLFSVNYLDREIRKDNANHVRETVQFSRNVNNDLERLSIYRLYHNYIKPYRINPTKKDEDYISKDEVHGQVAGIKRELIAAELKTLFTRRRFYSRIKWRSFQEMRLWLRGFPTPGKLMSEYVPLYAWA